MRSRIAMVAFLAAGLLGALAHAAPPEGKGPGHNRGEHAGQPGKGNQGQGRGHYRERDSLGALIDAGITAALARQYARSAGVSDYSSLPPGIRKNLMRGKPLPPGIARKVQSNAFLDRLPRHPGYEWQVAGTDLILVAIATGVIADILYDVFD